MTIKIASRSSKLALAQVEEFVKKFGISDYKIINVKTEGDIKSANGETLFDKAHFVSDVQKCLLNGEADIAVHSAKDTPAGETTGLLRYFLPSQSNEDVLIFREEDKFNSEMKLGTSSLRRAVQVSRIRQDVVVKPVRGNIETRVNKVTDGKFDAVILAEAGISRLGLDVKHSILSTKDFPPSPGQGALAIVCRADDEKTISMLKKIEDEKSRNEIEAERALSEYVESGCRFPVGALATTNSDILKLTVSAYSVDGKKAITLEKTGDVDKPRDLGKEIGEELQKTGISEIASNWRESLDEWNKK